MKISKIVHIADIHQRKSIQRNEEYSFVYKNLYKSIEQIKPDRIVIVGDLFNDFLDTQSEQLIMCSELLNNLALLTDKVIITRGNHDLRKSHLSRIDSIDALVKIINNPKICYINETGFFDDENVTWCVWKHGDKNNNPWMKFKKYKKREEQTYIDLFHDPINGSISDSGYEFKSNTYYKISDFKGNYLFGGDIHKHQYLNKEKTAAYSGSLIAQNFAEGDDNFHGYLLWNIENKTVEKISIDNEWSFKNIKINPYTEFKDLNIEIENPTKFMRVRILWQTLPAYRTNENERLLFEYLKNKYGDNIVSIKHKNEFLQENKIDIIENEQLLNINDKAVQHDIFKEFLIKIGVGEEDINEILKIDDEITSRIVVEDLTNIEWDIVKYSAKNFMSYENVDIDLQNKNGIFQIAGKNTAGKTTIALKLITYILFNQAIETEKRIKFGDSRFINNKLDVNFCEASMIINVHNNYYGIKRRTNITRNKQGEITGSPTILNYYILSSPNDELNENNIIDKLNEEERKKTQKEIDKIIGTFENFLRVSLTTSDTLNKILSSDPADFIDSLLYDSGLDIFDKKLESFKEYQKELNSKSRIVCNVENTEKTINEIEENNKIINKEINDIVILKIPESENKIKIGDEYVENLRKKLYNIDSEIYNLNINDINKQIKNNNDNINELNNAKKVHENSIINLCESYDEAKLNELLSLRDNHKQKENNFKFEIKDIERKIAEENHKIEIINGQIFNLKKDGGRLKENVIKLNKEIKDLTDSKSQENPICPTCAQEIVPEHLKHIDEKISEKNDEIKNIVKEIYGIAKNITDKETIDIVKIKEIISNYNNDINIIKDKIKNLSLEMEKTLNLIGELTNQKNDVEKRKEIVSKIEKIPFQIENVNLQNKILNDKVDRYNKSLTEIEENKKINATILLAKEKLTLLNKELDQFKELKIYKENDIKNNVNKINDLKNLIEEFKKQEKRDNILNIYKKIIHRDGIPRQLLINNIIPKINNELCDLLLDMPFKVWLDPEDIKPKLAYYNNLNAVIDCISSSGKERTFSAVSLKVALNQINAKSKASIFLLDEVTGKLIDSSTDEFVQLLNLIKNKIKKIFIIEHNIEVNPDYIITIERSENGISTAIIE